MKKAGETKEKNKLSEKTIDPSMAAELLGVSVATVRNWTKLGRLVPASSSPICYYEKDIKALSEDLEGADKLKSRRNKKRLSTNFIPKSYISTSSPNYPVIKDILEKAFESEVSLSFIMYHSAKKLLKESCVPDEISKELLKSLKDVDVHGLSDFDPECTDCLHFIPGEDTLGMLYLSLRRLQDKKSTGSYYTPFYVVDRLVTDIALTKDIEEKTICDPACGTGNFLMRLPSKFLPENIYGCDIDSMAVSIARINLAMNYKIKTLQELQIIINNIRPADFLGICKVSAGISPIPAPVNKPGKKSFDLIIGNPPWGYVYSKKEIQDILASFNSYGSEKTPESFSLFLETSLERLTEGGTLSFLLPETILSAATHKNIRSHILKDTQITSITYLGDVFYKVQCPSVILTLRKLGDISCSNSESIRISFEKPDHESFVCIKEFTSLSHSISGHSFNILADDEEKRLIDNLLSVPHFYLKDNADFALGIVTGQNKELLKNSPATGLEPILKGKDIEKYRYKKATDFVRFEPEKFQQCAPEHMYRAKEKLFYRFIADRPIVALDNGMTLSLNSANIIVPRVDGYSPAYIMAVLNSSVIAFFYKKSFKNLKVLRAYLEQLPIAKCSLEDERQISDMALQLSSMPYDSKELCTLEKKLDKQIAKLYGINDTEYQKITSKI